MTRPSPRASLSTVSAIDVPADWRVVPDPAAWVSHVLSWSPTSGICPAWSPAPVRAPLTDRPADVIESAGARSCSTVSWTWRPAYTQSPIQSSMSTSDRICRVRRAGVSA